MTDRRSKALSRELACALLDAIRGDEDLRAEFSALLVDDLAPREHGSRWLTVREAAEYLRVSERTVQRFEARGRIRSTTIGRRRLYQRDELDALAATGEEAAPTAPPRRRRATIDGANRS